MRRSSCVMLVLASALLGGAGAICRLASAPPAPPMSPAVARDIVARGKAAFERRDPAGLMALVAPNAAVFGHDPAELGEAIDRMAADAAPGDLRIDSRDLVVARLDGRETFSVSVIVGHRAPKADIVYYRLRLTCDLERRRTTSWLGLVSREEWLITRMTSVPPLEIE